MPGISSGTLANNQLRDFRRNQWEGFCADSVKNFARNQLEVFFPESVGEILSEISRRDFAWNQLRDFARNQLMDFARLQLEGCCLESVEGFIRNQLERSCLESVGGFCPESGEGFLPAYLDAAGSTP